MIDYRDLSCWLYIGAASVLTIAACGRLGFETDSSNADLQADAAAGNSPDAAMVDCEEVLLTTVNATLNGVLHNEITTTSITLFTIGSENAIGLNKMYSSGYQGVVEIRPSDDPQFESVVALLSDGTETQVRVGIENLISGDRASALRSLPDSLLGTQITMLRQEIHLLTFMSDGAGRSDFSFMSTWEFHGCPASG